MDTPTEDTPPAPPLETLTELAEASQAKRLSTADEERATVLLKELLNGKRSGIASALEPLLQLPWIVSVNAVIGVWPDLSIPMRRLVLSGLGKHDSEASRRLRLSLARALFKVDPPVGLKLAATVAGQLRDAETGNYPPRHRQIFFNVLIGKGKPWLLHLPLAELKAADAHQLLHGAAEVFSFCSPISQLSILRWAEAAGRLKKLPEGDLALLAKGVARWQGRLQRQLRAEIADLPEAIVAVLKPERKPDEAETAPATEKGKKAAPAPEAGSEEPPAETAAPDAATSRQPEPQKALNAPVEPLPLPEPQADQGADTGEASDGDPASRVEKKPEGRSRSARDEARSEEAAQRRLSARERQEARAAERRAEREQRERDRERERDKAKGKAQAPGGFDFKESLRHLDAYVGSLRNELETTKAQLRRKEEEAKRGGSRRGDRHAVEERRPVDLDAVLLHNAQLEATVQTLRLQLEDLASHHESVAESRNLHSDEPIPEGSAEQLKTLLAIKLQEMFETYHAMRLDPLDRVFRLDYRDLLGSVFDVLIEQGVALEEKETKSS
ncbi:MAG TPA: hypothetical protein VNQ90_04550 [Chthoniobacteraceae bacterium]|nr:hypothetical protein [Chthoniobacteraceae bacterium]